MMSHTEHTDSPQILVVSKEIGGIFLPILCFLVGMMNFALLANVANSFKIAQQKDALPTEEVQQELTAERLSVSRKNKYKKRIINGHKIYNNVSE